MRALPALLRRSEVVIGLVLVLAMLAIGAVNPAFWGPANLFALLRSNVIIGIMALGVLVVLISGGIDVSFPAFAVAAMYLTVRAMLDWGFGGVVLPFVMAVAIGLALGAVNAFFVHTVRMIPLIVTLGTGSAVRGFLLGLVGTSVINIDRMPRSLIEFGRTEIASFSAADGSRYGLSATVLVYVGLAVLVHLLLRHTLIGRSVYALGGDAEAARRAGFDLRRTTYFVYGLAGALAGFAGLLHGSMVWLANPREFIGLELDVIAAVVLGGASIFGGRGSVPGTMLGVFMLVMVNNSLIIMHVDTTWQRVVTGAILIAATAATSLRDRRALA
ncbi:MAG TPA: ABC transporter permease [Acetobacteraceae bacterium]|nr:ABC transporter permease [Acetobacteraceae bacterium]